MNLKKYDNNEASVKVRAPYYIQNLFSGLNWLINDKFSNSSNLVVILNNDGIM